MQEKLQWVLNNKEWLFSGAGLLIFTFIIFIIKLLFRSKKNGNKSNKQKLFMFTFGSNNKAKNTQKNEQ